jgi:hypothetical protein
VAGPVAKAAAAMSMMTLMACYGAGPRYQPGLGPGGACSPVDRDGDGFFVCAEGEGTLPRAKDCDDANPQIFPGAPETPGDGLDQNCDGSDEAEGSADAPALPTSVVPPVSGGAPNAGGPSSPSNNTNVVAQ